MAGKKTYFGVSESGLRTQYARPGEFEEVKEGLTSLPVTPKATPKATPKTEGNYKVPVTPVDSVTPVTPVDSLALVASDLVDTDRREAKHALSELTRSINLGRKTA